MAPLCPEGSFYSGEIKTAEDTRVNQAEGMRLRHKGGRGDEWLTLISVLVSTAGGAQRHRGGWPGFTPVTARSLVFPAADNETGSLLRKLLWISPPKNKHKSCFNSDMSSF